MGRVVHRVLHCVVVSSSFCVYVFVCVCVCVCVCERECVYVCASMCSLITCEFISVLNGHS